MRKSTRWLWVISIATLFLTGAACLLFFLPFDRLKPLVDHLGRDGRLDSFTFSRYQVLAVFLPWLGFLLVAGGLLLIIFRHKTLAWLSRLVEFTIFQMKATWSDFKLSWHGIRNMRPAVPV